MKTLIEKVYWVVLALVVFTLPFFDNLNSILIGVFCVLSLFSTSFSYKLIQLKKNPWVFMFIAYYLIQGFSLLNSFNVDVAIRSLETKGGMVMAPLFIATGLAPSRSYFKRTFEVFSIVLTLALTLAATLNLIDLLNGNTQEFGYQTMASQITCHAGYLSLYTSACIIFLLSSNPENIGEKVRHALSFILFLMLFVLAARMIFMATIIALIPFILQRFSIDNILKSWKFYLIGLISLAMVSPLLINRFGELQKSLEVLNSAKYQYDTPMTGITLRTTIWQLSIETLSNEDAWLFGVGNGDSQSLLQQAYRTKGLYTGNPDFNDRGYLDYNAHNQFIEETLRNGIIGLLVLILLFWTLWKIGHENSLVVPWLMVFVLFCITESVLERQTGNLFLSILIPLIIKSRQG